MKSLFTFLLILLSLLSFSQEKDNNKKPKSFIKTEEQKAKDNSKIAKIDLYKVFTIERDTSYIDTTLTIQKEHSFNFLRRDIFGLLPFANEGHTYNTLKPNLQNISSLPQFGFEAKHFNYLQPHQIKYYSVPTPLTELYFKTVMEQGQSLDAFVTMNTNERLNFSIAYKGLRSTGRFVNQLASSGNFRFTTNYNTKNKRYFLKLHATVQDILNAENGGIIFNENFESNNPDFQDRNRLEVYLRDASSFLKGNRYFINQLFRINANESENNLFINYQFTHENKFFEYRQNTIFAPILFPSQTQPTLISRFGDSYRSSAINDRTNFTQYFNRLEATYENKTLGEFKFFIEDSQYNYFYNSTLIVNNKIIPSAVSERFTSIGGQYFYQKNKLNANLSIANAISNQGISDINLRATYQLNDENEVAFHYQKVNKAPNINYNFYQSSFVLYNWFNDFKNEKFNNISLTAVTKWVDVELQYSIQNDRLYFGEIPNAATSVLEVKPLQYDGTINYAAIKLSKNFNYGPFGLDNTLLFQKTDQAANILNVPEIVVRNSLYYKNTAFKKAMEYQTGFTLNYFTAYYANDYNPLIGEFYIQEQKKIGNFPLIDFFINAKVLQTRIFLKAEHFNSMFTKPNYYSAPSYPYRDFIVRFGLVWNFFQ